MNSIKQQLNNELKYLNKKIQSISHNSMSKPDWKLKACKRKNGHYYYYKTFYDNNGKKHIEFLSKKREEAIIKQLAQRDYEIELLRELINEKAIITSFLSKYMPESKKEVYENASPGRKPYIDCLLNENEIIFNEWVAQSYKAYTAYPERLLFKTDRGEMVRSKSEVIIANMLNSIPDIYYKYEAPLFLQSSDFTIHPDFTIMRKSDNKIFYWEHAGMLDNHDYANSHIIKLNQYMKEGLIQNNSLILTLESCDVPLDIDLIRKIVCEYFIDEKY